MWRVYVGTGMHLFSGNGGKNLSLLVTEVMKFLENLQTAAQITLQGQLTVTSTRDFFLFFFFK